MSQKEQVLRLLQSGRRITQAKALAFNVWRLADVIYKLKRDGYRIRAELKTAENGKRYAEYTMMETAQ